MSCFVEIQGRKGNKDLRKKVSDAVFRYLFLSVRFILVELHKGEAKTLTFM